MCLNDAVPTQYLSSARKTGEYLADMEDILLAAHVNLDGDALGALAACGYLFKKLGKRFALYSSTGVPPYLRFLDLPGPVYKDLAFIPFMPQNAVYLDCSEPARLGPELEEKYLNFPSVNIDHHLCANGLGSLFNFIEPSAAATSQLVAYVAEELGQPLKGPLACAITLGLMTDTGGFCHGNTTADVFALCAKLARGGCDMMVIRENLQNSWSLDKLHLWGKAFELVKLHDHGEIAICAVPASLLEECHCAKEDLEGLVEWLRKIRGVKAACFLREEAKNKCKFSLRSVNDVNVQLMAAELGGGGHKNAAGGELFENLRTAEKLLLNIMEKQLHCGAQTN